MKQIASSNPLLYSNIRKETKQAHLAWSLLMSDLIESQKDAS